MHQSRHVSTLMSEAAIRWTGIRWCIFHIYCWRLGTHSYVHKERLFELFIFKTVKQHVLGLSPTYFHWILCFLPCSSNHSYLPCFVQKTPESFLRGIWFIGARPTGSCWAHRPREIISGTYHIGKRWWSRQTKQIDYFLPCLDSERDCLLYIVTRPLPK